MSNDGGPAFPGETVMKTDEGFEVQRGMTLRDYFAGQAMAALIPVCLHDTDDDANPAIRRYPEYISKLAYANADAMIAARTPSNDKGET